MKLINKVILGIALCGSLIATSCTKFLDRQPLADLTPELYFNSASDLAAYLVNYYPTFLVNIDGTALFTNGSFNGGPSQSTDYWTDNLSIGTGSAVLKFFGDGSHWTVSDGRSLYNTYSKIRIVNWFLDYVTPKMEAGGPLAGDKDCEHYLGEAYFLRAIAYYVALAQYGDLPIIDKVLPDDDEVLQELSVRAPRNEVARFILSDLDKAISLLKDRSAFGGQRINKESAYLLKSRVALFEGTFEKYHKGSGRVPGDSNWPGGSFSGNIDSEINFFLDQAMSAAKEVADNVPLTANSHVLHPGDDTTVWGWNPYFEMFGQLSLSDVPEVLMWREYSTDLGIGHTVAERSVLGFDGGLTYSLVKSFLMKNGLPIYAEGSGYQGDKSVEVELTDRDERLQLFCWSDSYPNRRRNDFHFEFDILGKVLSNLETRITTGYGPRKYYCYDEKMSGEFANYDETACPIFRSAEAYLNYIEACYEKTGAIDATASKYWKALRERAGVDADFEKTIAATDLSKETADWGLYSGNTTVDKTLFNIRRERRAEFVAENMRLADMLRWRSFDHLNTENVQVMGMNFWDEYIDKYEATKATTGLSLIADGSPQSNMSAQSLGKYIFPYRKTDLNNELTNGLKWHDAYYLYPLGHEDFVFAPKLYQNVNWGTDGGTQALK